MERRTREQGWIAQEPGWREFAGDVRRLYRRNRSRPLPFLFFVVLCAVFGLWKGYTYQPTYEARIALRLIEKDIGAAVVPRPAAALRAFVTDVALSERKLIGILDRFKLYPEKRARGLDQAIEALREDIAVEVWRNEFVFDDPDDPLGRSARVALGYKHRDPDVSFGVVQALADAFLAEQRRMRMAQVEYLALGLEPAIESARESLSQLKLAQTRSGVVLMPGQRYGQPAPGQPVARNPLDVLAGRQAVSSTLMDQLQGPLTRKALPYGLRVQSPALALQAEIDEEERRLKELLERKSEAELRLKAETRDLALRTDIIDYIRPQATPFHGAAISLGLGAGLLCGLLLGGLVMRAFDRAVYEPEDVTRLGLSYLGSLPSFPGDHIGSMRERMKTTKRRSRPSPAKSV